MIKVNLIMVPIFLLFSTISFSAVSYKNFNIGDSYSNIINILQAKNITYEEEENSDYYGEVGLYKGKLVKVSIMNEYGQYFYDENYNKLKFLATIKCKIISFKDSNGRVGLFFDYNDKLIEILIKDLEIEYNVLKRSLNKKYGPPRRSWKNQMTMGIIFNRSGSNITISQYVDGSGLSVNYENPSLVYKHKLHQYKIEKVKYDKKLNDQSNSVKGF